MHWSRWGDPAEAGPLSESAFALVDAFIGTSETPAVDPAASGSRPCSAGSCSTSSPGSSAPSTCSPTTTPGCTAPAASPPPTCSSSVPATAATRPTPSYGPARHDEVAALIAWAVERHVALVPFGGGTSVVGGLVARREGFAGVVSLDLIRFDKLLAVDTESMTATLEPGLRGPAAEALLAEHGLTLGHFPQSFEYASIGGFAVTRSSGQSSAGYGRFDSLVVGLRVATPQGELVLGNSPANAAGPDLREVVMGSEGAFGVVTAVTVRVRHAARGEGLRELALGLLRRRCRRDAHARAGRCAPDRAAALRRERDPDQPGQAGRGRAASRGGGCLMVTGFEGTQEAVDAKRTAVHRAALPASGGTSLGEDEGWSSGRFHGPYLRDSLLDVGVLVETLETVTFWSNLHRVYDAVKDALTSALGEGTLVLCHISHVYETGASLYFTVAAKQSDDPRRAVAGGEGRRAPTR